MEHRWGTRVPVHLNVRLRCERFTLRCGIMRDASVSGAFIETPVLPPLYSRVQVSFSFGTERYSLLGYITRQDHDGVGVEWAELAPQAICRQLQLIEKRAMRPYTKTTSNSLSVASRSIS